MMDTAPMWMSMWTPTCGQGWAQLAAHFVAMWTAMMALMMAPSLAPLFWRYRAALATRRNLHAAVMVTGYLGVWAVLGVAVFAIGSALSELALRWVVPARVLPLITCGILLIAGIGQFTRWKSHHLAACRHAPRCDGKVNVRQAWRHGVQLGLHCVRCSAGLTLALLALGMMQPWVMVAATVATALERLAPAGERAARVVGVVLVVAAAPALVLGG
jgi:predicted metal-binding membrane protein